MKTTIKNALIAMSLSTVAVSTAFAATDGTEGANSTGTANVSMEVASAVMVSGMADITLTDTAGSDRTGSTNVCVYSNAASYSLTASGSGAASEFQIENATGDTLDYTLGYNDGSTTSALTSTTAVTGLADHSADADCATEGGSTASLEVTIATADADAAPAGSYAGVLTILVAAE